MIYKPKFIVSTISFLHLAPSIQYRCNLRFYMQKSICMREWIRKRQYSKGGPENLSRSRIMCPANLKMRRFLSAQLFPKKNCEYISRHDVKFNEHMRKLQIWWLYASGNHLLRIFRLTLRIKHVTSSMGTCLALYCRFLTYSRMLSPNDPIQATVNVLLFHPGP